MKANRLRKVTQLDIISTLPQPIIDTILCCLSIEEAVRTSILSREWRYKWTTISKLRFFHSLTAEEQKKQLLEQRFDTESARKNRDKTLKFLHGIHQVLLMHQGPIHEFALFMKAHGDYKEIDQILLHLSRNRKVKKLRLDCFHSSPYSVPASVFSMNHLEDLHLVFCDINHKPIFNQFGCLRDLTLAYVKIHRETLLHLLSNCPSLKSLSLLIVDEDLQDFEIPNIKELFEYSPLIEKFITWGEIIPSLVLASDLRELPPSLIHLKYFIFHQLGFGDVYGLTFLTIVMKCSPNLEKLRLQIETDDGYEKVEADKLEGYSVILEQYSDVWLEHLYKLKIEYFRSCKVEMDLLKFILARSPNLKKVVLRTVVLEKAQEVQMLKTLLRTPYTSSIEFIVERHEIYADD